MPEDNTAGPSDDGSEFLRQKLGGTPLPPGILDLANKTSEILRAEMYATIDERGEGDEANAFSTPAFDDRLKEALAEAYRLGMASTKFRVTPAGCVGAGGGGPGGRPTVIVEVSNLQRGDSGGYSIGVVQGAPSGMPPNKIVVIKAPGGGGVVDD